MFDTSEISHKLAFFVSVSDPKIDLHELTMTGEDATDVY